MSAPKAKPVEKKADAKDAKDGKDKKDVKRRYIPGVGRKGWKESHSHLFEKRPKSFKIGRDVQPKGRDLSRFVKWPHYVRLQRMRAVLQKRLKVPPAINQFTKTLDKNQAQVLFKLLGGYSPETAEQKMERLKKKAALKADGKTAEAEPKPKLLKFGINHITQLVESRKAKLVVIAHDVDPIELVVWLPTLCRRMDVPYCIVKGKARLGQLVHQKTVTAVALTEVRKENQGQFEQLLGSIKNTYSDADRRKWGGGILGIKARHVQKAREKLALKEATKAAKV